MADSSAPLQGTWAWARLPLALAAVLGVVFAATLLTTPEGKLNWLLEVGPGLIGMAALALTFRRFPMSRIIYVTVFLHILVLVYGGFYTYAKAPLGEWAREAFGWQRNNYDKIGHFAFGFFPVLILREVLLRRTKLERGGWLTFILINVILGFGAIYEFIEWWSALLLDPAGGDKFLGTQGDIWDAQSDMLFAGLGAAAALLVLRPLHERSLKRLFDELGPR
jgi:putative membrane protein